MKKVILATAAIEVASGNFMQPYDLKPAEEEVQHKPIEASTEWTGIALGNW